MADPQSIEIDGSKLAPTQEVVNIPDQNKAESTDAYVDVMGLSPYDFMEHTYNGTHGYKDRSYLVPGIREVFYERRRKLSYYVNIFKPIVDSMIDDVFTATITRKTNGNKYAEGFILDCDAAGSPLSVIIKNAITTARICALSFIVVENFKQTEIGETEEENIKGRKFPYIYEKKPQEIYKHTTNRQGALESITFYDRLELIKQEKNTVRRQWYRYFDNTTWKEFYIDDPKDANTDKEVPVSEGNHGLGVIPVIPITDFARNASLKELPESELYTLAVLCWALFQKESMVVMGELYQTYPLLVTCGWGRNALQAGPTNFIDVANDVKFMPDYIAPPQEGIKTLVSNCERLKEEIKNEASQQGVVGLKQSESGYAKEWDFRAKEVKLKETAVAAMALEYKIIALVGKYLRTSFGYEVTYETNYQPNSDAIRSDRMMKIIDSVPSGPLNIAAQKEIVKLEWKQSPDTVKEVTDEIEEKEEERDTIRKMVEDEAKAAADAETAAAAAKAKEGGNNANKA